MEENPQCRIGSSANKTPTKAEPKPSKPRKSSKLLETQGLQGELTTFSADPYTKPKMRGNPELRMQNSFFLKLGTYKGLNP
jgi:hypothetical protein